MNIIVTREFYDKTTDGYICSFVDENIRKKGIIRPEGCTGLTIYNAAKTAVFVNNIPLNGLESKSFRALVPNCTLVSEFKINDAIVGSASGIEIPEEPTTL